MNSESSPVNVKERISKILQEYDPHRENLLSILHHIQDIEPLHYIPPEYIQHIADHIHMPPSQIVGVISFYSLLSLIPRSPHIIRVCTSTPCHVMGNSTVISMLKATLGISPGQTTDDGLFTLETTSCLGLCDQAPAMMINDTVYGSLTPRKIEKIIERKRHGRDQSCP
ncbi:MAG: NADH-quinone oxidoreductase subunit NuoE [Candidatus Thorarchaeota archaeon]|jgi:NADH:ubiquinone oxidoreductase subunit E